MASESEDDMAADDLETSTDSDTRQDMQQFYAELFDLHGNNKMKWHLYLEITPMWEVLPTFLQNFPEQKPRLQYMCSSLDINNKYILKKKK